MKRTFLKDLGLEDDVINQIMAEHGKTVQQQQDSIEKLNQDLTTANAELSEAKQDLGKIEQLEQENEELKESYEESKKRERSKDIEIALIAEGGTDLDYLKFKLGDIGDDDIDEAVKGLKDELPDFFQTKEKSVEENTKGYKVLDRPLAQGDEPKVWTIESIMGIDDNKKRQKLIQENPQLFRK